MLDALTASTSLLVVGPLLKWRCRLQLNRSPLQPFTAGSANEDNLIWSNEALFVPLWI